MQVKVIQVFESYESNDSKRGGEAIEMQNMCRNGKIEIKLTTVDYRLVLITAAGCQVNYCSRGGGRPSAALLPPGGAPWTVI